MSQLNGEPKPAAIEPEILTAYALDQLPAAERATVERLLAEPRQVDARQLVAQTRRLAEMLPAVHAGDVSPERDTQLRTALLERSAAQPAVELPEKALPEKSSRRRLVWLTVGGLAIVLALAVAIPPIQRARETARRMNRSNGAVSQSGAVNDRLASADGKEESGTSISANQKSLSTLTSEEGPQVNKPVYEGLYEGLMDNDLGSIPSQPTAGESVRPVTPLSLAQEGEERLLDLERGARRLKEEKIAQLELGAVQSELTDNYGNYSLAPPVTESLSTRNPRRLARTEEEARSWYKRNGEVADVFLRYGRVTIDERNFDSLASGEQYEPIVENLFLDPTAHPLSTFSIDVDTASYSNVRRFLTSGRLPPPNAVRIEELVNYFRYTDPQPKGAEPFSVNLETAECPWQPGNLLLRVGLQGKEIPRTERPASNLVFLLDVSGSMSDENKLPLVKTSLAQFVAELTENDRVSIVTYAGDAGLRLPPTSGDQHDKIMGAIDSLSAGGSTHGSAGIQLAYEQAAQYFLKEGTNRVILATDGDLNVGVTSDDALVELIKTKAAAGTFLTVLGFGEGNLQDAKLEKLADHGNGMYAYIDGVREGRKVLVEQMTGSTITIAKDVKIQIEFNPAEIASYRLLGYENRLLAAKDFADDKKDAGEIGAGHAVTALYELVPVGKQQTAAKVEQPAIEPLKYQEAGARGQESEVRGQESGVSGQGSEASGRRQPPDSADLTEAAASGELLTLKLRYKQPDGDTSKLLELPHKDRGGKFNAASKDLQFASAVASFGMILRGSEHKGSGNLAAVAEIASGALGEDAGGYRAEFVDLVRKAQALGAK
ncbi:MAG: von Willebrand factor type A domain-containing protein [Pirellulaceae bacterium]